VKNQAPPWLDEQEWKALCEQRELNSEDRHFKAKVLARVAMYEQIALADAGEDDDRIEPRGAGDE